MQQTPQTLSQLVEQEINKTSELISNMKAYVAELSGERNFAIGFKSVLQVINQSASKSERVSIAQLSRLISHGAKYSFLEFLADNDLDLIDFTPKLDDELTLSNQLTPDEFQGFLNQKNQNAWDTESTFKPVDDWHEDYGDCLFFRLDEGEPPVVTSPLSSDWDQEYFTHFMVLPKQLRKTSEFVKTCIASGIITEEIRDYD